MFSVTLSSWKLSSGIQTCYGCEKTSSDRLVHPRMDIDHHGVDDSPEDHRTDVDDVLLLLDDRKSCENRRGPVVLVPQDHHEDLPAMGTHRLSVDGDDDDDDNVPVVRPMHRHPWRMSAMMHSSMSLVLT